MLSLIFTFFMIFNSVAYAYMDHCIDESECAVIVDECHHDSNADNSTEKQKDSSHSQCEMHCFHPQGFYNQLRNVEFNQAPSLAAEPYSFHFNQVFIDGLLRPPLV